MISLRSAVGGVGLGLAIAVSMPVSARQPAAGATGELSVTVNYQGKGPVRKGNEIGVVLFDTVDIGGPRKPIAVKVLERNGDTAHFTGLTAATVYVVVAYDESGTWRETQGPAPPGAPISVYGVKGDPNDLFDRKKTAGSPAGVHPGPGAKVTVTFDDSYPSK